MQRNLTPGEVSDLLQRNFDLQAKVLAHTRIVESGQWDQIEMNESVFEQLPIPTKGRLIQDEKFGLVAVFPDASGKLHYSASLPAILADSDIKKPAFHSPSGNTPQQWLEDLKKLVLLIISGLIVTAFVYRAMDSHD